MTSLGGGLFYFLTKSTNHNYLKLSLAFSGAYLFSVSIVHLIPATYQSGGITVGYYILGGFFLQLILEYFSEGIEHGHIHIHQSKNPTIPISLMLGLCIHSFMEGMPLSSHFDHQHHHESFFRGIVLHHIPVAFALTSMLAGSGLKNRTVVVLLLIFSLMTPSGAWFSSILGDLDLFNIQNYYPNIMGIVVGIFLHISTTILFETGSDHKYNRNKILVIILGATAALLL